MEIKILGTGCTNCLALEKRVRKLVEVYQIDAKITMVNSFILCLPGETEDMVEKTIKFAKSLASQVSLFYLPVPYPGSELYKICKKDGGIRENAKWSEYLSIDFDNPIYICYFV